MNSPDGWRAASRACARVLLAACASTATAQVDVYVDAGRGPVGVHVPPGYTDAGPTALVLILHGYGSSAERLERYVEFTPLADAKGFLLALPNGLSDPLGFRYWNGTDVCCDYFANTDDSGYLRALIDTIAAGFDVDPRRVFFFGHSNGGFMAHRMACDHADAVAAIASLGGATWQNPADCNPSAPVATLEIHGTADTTISYGGGCVTGQRCYPSASATAGAWALLNHCGTGQTRPNQIDLTEDVPGADTGAYTYGDCDAGATAALWSVFTGPHHPTLTTSFNDSVVQYLLAHPKPSPVACSDVESFTASCDAEGTLVARLRLNDPRHHDTTVDLHIDGELTAARVTGMQTKTVLAGQRSGAHRVRLVDPVDCVADLEVSCGD